MSQPWKDPRTGIYYIRKRIPARFAGVPGAPRGIYKRSLGTKDAAEAKRLWPRALALYQSQEAEWDRLADAVMVTPPIAAKIVSAWVAAVVGGAITLSASDDDHNSLAKSLPGRRVRAGRNQEHVEAETASAVARTNELVALHTREALDLAGIAVNDPGSPILHEGMLRAIRAAYRQARDAAVSAAAHHPLERLQERLPPPDTPQPRPAGVPMSELYNAWKAVATVAPRTIAEAKYAMDALTRSLGHSDATKISRVDVIKWRDDMKAAGATNNTWNNRSSLVRQIFARAVADGKLDNNPVDGLRLPKSRAAVRYPYSDDDAVKILTASRKESRPSRRWAHWIMAFTGMRIAEVLQLSIADIQHDGSIHFFVVEGDSDGKSVKNGERRHVPIHPALIAEGLLTYAATLPADGPLFPDKGTDAHGLRGTRGWQTVGRWVRDIVGITDPHKVPNHSWRHRVEDELRAAGVDESIRDAILGHARKTTGRQYGIRGESLKRLSDAVALIPVPRGL